MGTLESHPEDRRMLKLVVLLLAACLLHATTANPEPEPQPQWGQMGRGGRGFLGGFMQGLRTGLGACGQMEAGPPRGGQIPSYDNTLRWHEGIRATKWWPTSLVGHQTLKWHGQGRLGPSRGGPSIPTYGIRI